MKKYILGILLGILLSSGVVYGANLYKSSDIIYNKNNITNVEEALNDLYDKTSNVYYLGDAASATYDIKNLYPSIDYTKLTEDNFICESLSGSANISGTRSAYNTQSTTMLAQASINISKFYDSTTGILTVSGTLNAYANLYNKCDIGGNSAVSVKTYFVPHGIK